jgi:hypothetical protein
MLSIICTMDVLILCNLSLSNVVVLPPSCSVGIPNGLHICGTGTLALKGNLSAGEMLEQLVHAHPKSLRSANCISVNPLKAVLLCSILGLKQICGQKRAAVTGIRP